MKKRALITGINGMDGSHLADLLLDKNYDVFGLERRVSTKNRINTSHLDDGVYVINVNTNNTIITKRITITK